VGGEESGHLIFRNHHSTGDGIIAGLQLLGAMRFYDESLSGLAKVMTPTPQRVLNLEVCSKPPLETIPGLSEAVAEAEQELGDQGRVLIRYSGTQSLCRVMVEGPSAEVTEKLAERLGAVVSRELGPGR
jgi:phosphoglucosamine mutase